MKHAERRSPELLLASQSATRRQLLSAVGLAFEAVAPGVDEAEIKRSMAAEQASGDAVAQALAELKAVRVTMRRPGALVIGADLVLVCQGQLYDKAHDLAEARANLLQFAGRMHELPCAVAVARDGAVIWRHLERPRLHMRSMPAEDIDRYLAQVGEEALHSVGAYHLEGRGAQLFERVEGDFFSVLGLPLLPLLAFLRTHDIVPG